MRNPVGSLRAVLDVEKPQVGTTPFIQYDDSRPLREFS
jgi:hypothetical protein